jgi:hypothetical protein
MPQAILARAASEGDGLIARSVNRCGRIRDGRALDATAWDAIVPSMGIFALAKNLRNFDQAGVSDIVAEQVCAKISDPAVVVRFRMFLFRLWAAYKHSPSLRWATALDKAINLSMSNVPALAGRTLVLVDRSPSMFPGYSFSTPHKGDIAFAEQAAIFGAAVAQRAADATLVEFRKTLLPAAIVRLRIGRVCRTHPCGPEFTWITLPSTQRSHGNRDGRRRDLGHLCISFRLYTWHHASGRTPRPPFGAGLTMGSVKPSFIGEAFR